jgi:hypothetical protein
MSSFSKSSHSRHYMPFSTLSLNLNYQPFSATSTPLPKTHSTAFLKQEKQNKDSTDLKNFKEKYQIEDQFPPVSCLKLIKTHPPKMFISLEDLNKVNFPVISYSINDLVNFSRLILDSSPERRMIAKSFNTTRLIQLLAENYNVTAYHNFTHAFSLLLVPSILYSSCTKLTIDAIASKRCFLRRSGSMSSSLPSPTTSNILEPPMHSKSKLRVSSPKRQITCLS